MGQVNFPFFSRLSGWVMSYVVLKKWMGQAKYFLGMAWKYSPKQLSESDEMSGFDPTDSTLIPTSLLPSTLNLRWQNLIIHEFLNLM